MKYNWFLIGLSAVLFMLAAIMAGGIGRILIILTVVLVLGCSLCYYAGLPKSIACRIILPSSCRKKENIVGELLVDHRGLFPIFYGKAFFKIENLLTKEEEEFTLVITLMRKERGSSSFDFSPKYTGMIRATLDHVELYGLLGALKRTIPVHASREVMVLPKTFESRISLRPLFCVNEEGEKTIQARNGFDPGVYYGIRPFEDGDSIKQIHWKLTGKTDEYLIKELGMPAILLPVLYLETHVEKMDCAMIDAMMEAYVSISQQLLEDNYKHCLCWYDGRHRNWVWHTVEKIEQLDELFPSLLRAGFKEDKEPRFFRINADDLEKYGQVVIVSNIEAHFDDAVDKSDVVTVLLGMQERSTKRKRLHFYPFTPKTLDKDLYSLEL